MAEPNWSVSVIVADNDDTQSARDIVENTARKCGFPVRYLYAPARNISVARNACLDAATAPLVAFIDDDELASPQWLTALVATLESSKADVVLGPVQAIYQPGCPGWMVKGDFHSTRPVWVLCHEHHRSKRRCGTVREMKEGPSGSAIRSLIPSHRKLLWSKVTVVSVAETPGR